MGNDPMAGEGDGMSAALESPPRWAEFVLERILADADWRIVTGDLREEYAETILPRLGRLKAHVWYLLQVLSFVPRGASQPSRMRGVLLLTSLVTFSCGCWLALMEWLLRHPGYLLRAAEDIAIAAVPLATIAVLFLHFGVRAERWLWVGAITIIAIAVQALVRDVRSAHFEGFVLLISLVLTIQGSGMLLFLGRAVAARPFQSDPK